MASIYDDYYNQALGLQNHFHDVVDNHSHPQIQTLQHEIHELAQDFRAERNPHHLDDRLKAIEHQLLETRVHGDQLMSYADIDQLQHQYRRLRDSVRKMPNY